MFSFMMSRVLRMCAERLSDFQLLNVFEISDAAILGPVDEEEDMRNYLSDEGDRRDYRGENSESECVSNYGPSESSLTDLVRVAVARRNSFWSSNQYLVDEDGVPKQIGTSVQSNSEKVQAAGDRARAISPTLRPGERETGYFQAPVRVERGFNTLIWAKIGGVDVQVLIDTGAA